MLKGFKGIFALGLGVVFLASCGRNSNTGDLVGVQNRSEWKNDINPYGMVYIPSGTFMMGPSDQDISYSYVQRPKAISIQGFYMDDTEISNNEYRQFVHWVRDSIAHLIMGDVFTDDYGNEHIDWEYELDYRDETLDEMFYQGNDRVNGRRELDVRKLNYQWERYNLKAAAADRGKSPRSDFVEKFQINVYPDTLAWIRDFAYSFNEPMARNYFSHVAYDNYPVVGVNWHQAQAFCNWRTKIWNAYKDEPIGNDGFRLPTEAEWEYAARGGHELVPYPWGAYSLRNAKGCLLANFKPGRGNYPEDGGQWTVEVDKYDPNDYGLFNMAGNVSEWTSSAYHENSYSFLHDLNPDFKYDADENDPDAFKRKVVRGGSWKDVGYFLRTGVRDWQYQDTTTSYIGFRCALTFQGRSINDSY
ncbi:SUMF1/EgtB/PvdO family nonheme iron enzyme [Membranihabitans maritimus]|uniref:type IX secretion system lipoprotein PorK/GldK n=1 Tax=Membranihabitans maritimus TaxID=2904244 RepID=UPI001F38A6DD|nr:SUMF1/EgtB/PvdO family nonheme iron enzyme [Membranihabitans maritimus]